MGNVFALVETAVDMTKALGIPSALKLPALWQRGHLQSDTMKSLDDHDKRHFEAAQGWLILGNHLEANEELENITPVFRAHPDVLALRWAIYGKAANGNGPSGSPKGLSSSRLMMPRRG